MRSSRATRPRPPSRSTKSSTVHAALGVVAPRAVHADRAVLDVVVADDEHVRHLLDLGPPDARAERVGVRVDAPRRGSPRPSAGRRCRTAYASCRSATGSTATCTGASHARERAGVVLERGSRRTARSTPNSARWIMIGRCRSLSAPTYSRSKRCGSWKSTWIVDICHVRPIASRACTEIFGP